MYFVKYFILSVGFALLSYYYYPYSTPIEPSAALQAFAAQAESELQNASDVPLSDCSSFAGVACTEGLSAADVSATLRAALDDVPPSILDRILAKALPKENGESSARFETDLTLEGKHTYILAFWHTVTTDASIKSCVSLAGGTAKPADRVIGTTTKKKQTTVGFTACNCKFSNYFCSSCPLVEEEEESVLLTVPVRWSKKQHTQMQLALRKQSIEIIRHLPNIAGGGASPALSHYAQDMAED